VANSRKVFMQFRLENLLRSLVVRFRYRFSFLIVQWSSAAERSCVTVCHACS